jgi:3-deoxy-manno-octulosonate cytidylyltransferase (CMP-KDO synthetase)
VRDTTGPWIEHTRFWGHPGLYAYQRDFIAGLAELPLSPLDKAENLEQLQFLEAGHRMHSFEVAKQAPTVDVLEELEWVRREVALRSRG